MCKTGESRDRKWIGGDWGRREEKTGSYCLMGNSPSVWAAEKLLAMDGRNG
jgi:hypothetical protein